MSENLSNKQIEVLYQQLRQVILDTKQKYDLPGLLFAIALPMQKEILSFATGTTMLNKEAPILSSTLFQVGSTTKTFTAALLVQAVQNKYLSLNDKLGKFLPEYLRWHNITIRQLIDQTSGIYDYINSKDWWQKYHLAATKGRIYNSKMLLNIAYRHPNDFLAETRWGYSNANYVLLGLVLEQVTHSPISTLMQKLIGSAGLSHTHYLPSIYPKKIMRQMAHGYGYWNYPEIYDATIDNGSWAQTGGAMVSTPEDLVKWMQTLFISNKIKGMPITNYLQLRSTVSGKKITSYNQTGYSFGLFRMNTPEGIIWFTPGLTPGYMTAMVYAPCQNVFFAYSTNKALVKGLHGHIITNVLRVINSNQFYKELLQSNTELVRFCVKITPAKKFIFPI